VIRAEGPLKAKWHTDFRNRKPHLRVVGSGNDLMVFEYVDFTLLRKLFELIIMFLCGVS
jgi:hypothetical protein